MSNTDKMYIPNVNQWTRYYQHVVSGQSNAYVAHMKSGYNKESKSGSFMIPILNKSYPIRTEKEINFVVRLVSPSEQIVNQAKEEIKTDGESINKTDRKRKYHHLPQSRGEALKTTNAKYPFTKTMMKNFTIMQGSTSLIVENVFQDVKPKKYCAWIGFFNCYVWSIYKNPFNFMNYDLKQVTLFCDVIPVDGIPLKLDFNENSDTSNVSPNVKMFETGGKWMLDTGKEITRAEFNNGYTLLCFNLEPFFSDTKYLSLLKQGKIRLECQFGLHYQKQLPY
ncbi:unnamed protein product [Mytilus coruscus]|uniref:Uncharacterized protein n=1 Tax=Mytilus coruscus TaxID=42192 RepID=A0A6J8E299_MYTCO|nr:unnamed protein product [Mytilus coruscus]